MEIIMPDLDKADMRDVHEEDVNSTIDTTKRYNYIESNIKTFTYYAGFRALPQKMKEILKEDDNASILPEMNNITSKDEIIKLALEYLGKIDSRLLAMARNVLSNSSIDKNGIELAPADSPLSSTGKCSRDTDGRINIQVSAKRDATGIMAVAQNLIEAGLYDEYYKHEAKQDDKRFETAKNACKKFIGLAIIDAITDDPRADVSPNQEENLKKSIIREDMSHMETMEDDIEIFAAFMEAHEEEFGDLENLDEEKLLKAIDEGLDCNEHPELNDKIGRRIREISEKDLTPQYVIGDALETMVAVQAMSDLQNAPETDPIKNLVEGAVMGYNVQQITGKTPEELANATPNIIEAYVNGELTLDQQQALEQNEVVMEMIRHNNNNN